MVGFCGNLLMSCETVENPAIYVSKTLFAVPKIWALPDQAFFILCQYYCCFKYNRVHPQAPSIVSLLVLSAIKIPGMRESQCRPSSGHHTEHGHPWHHHQKTSMSFLTTVYPKSPKTPSKRSSIYIYNYSIVFEGARIYRCLSTHLPFSDFAGVPRVRRRGFAELITSCLLSLGIRTWWTGGWRGGLRHTRVGTVPKCLRMVMKCDQQKYQWWCWKKHVFSIGGANSGLFVRRLFIL